VILILLQTINWLRHDVTPIGVAEGLPPAEKLATLQARCMALYGFARSSALPAAGSLQQLSQAACKLLHAMVCVHIPMPRMIPTAQLQGSCIHRRQAANCDLECTLRPCTLKTSNDIAAGLANTDGARRS
jgi:hypothetical protein